MPFTIIREDITRLAVDVIVNAADTSLQQGGGVCGAIFQAAGTRELQEACDRLAPVMTGQVVITPGFNLEAKYIIHTAGPVYQDGLHGEESLLRSCYVNAMALAIENQCESIAFPLISSGIHGYPKAAALRVATDAIRAFLDEHDLDVTLAVPDKKVFVVSSRLLGDVKGYMDEFYVHAIRNRLRAVYEKEERRYDFEAVPGKLNMPPMAQAEMVNAMPFYNLDEMPAPASAMHLESLVGNLDEPFSATLLRLIDATGRKDSEIYRRANIDRRLFSKIRGNAEYAPSKATVLAFAVALELTLDQTRDLLARAGFALSRSRKFDVIVEYFIQRKKYEIFEINEVLFHYDQPLLGG